jgi:hypothetical protein
MTTKVMTAEERQYRMDDIADHFGLYEDYDYCDFENVKTKYAFEMNEFPHCCGIGVMCGFPIDSQFYRMDTKLANEVLIKAVKNSIKSAKDYGQGILMATTNREQKRMAAILEECGFVELYYFPNPVHKYEHSRIKLWVKDLTRRKTKKQLAEEKTIIAGG